MLILQQQGVWSSSMSCRHHLHFAGLDHCVSNCCVRNVWAVGLSWCLFVLSQHDTSALDLFIGKHDLVTSLVLLPFAGLGPRDSCNYHAGIYVTHSELTNFSAAKAAVVSIAGQLQHLVKALLLRESVMQQLEQQSSKVRAAARCYTVPAACLNVPVQCLSLLRNAEQLPRSLNSYLKYQQTP